jgi:hypothetical protein
VGFSATWIGAQGPRGHGPFIQLGTEEIEEHTTKAVTSPLKPYYLVFWSDDAVRFHSEVIVQVSRPGDLIAFDIEENPRGWKLNVHNLTVGWSRSAQVNYRTEQLFTNAEWVQEDPASAVRTTTDAPYASTSTVAFSDLTVNRRAPRLSYRNAQVLSTASGVYPFRRMRIETPLALLPLLGLPASTWSMP